MLLTLVLCGVFQPVTFSSVSDMLSVSVSLPEATLAYIASTQSVYVRVPGGWKEVLVSDNTRSVTVSLHGEFVYTDQCLSYFETRLKFVADTKYSLEQLV